MHSLNVPCCVVFTPSHNRAPPPPLAFAVLPRTVELNSTYLTHIFFITLPLLVAKEQDKYNI
jgi:hypothetical protein